MRPELALLDLAVQSRPAEAGGLAEVWECEEEARSGRHAENLLPDPMTFLRTRNSPELRGFGIISLDLSCFYDL